MAEFFDMGGYAGFVWPPYALAALVMIALALAARRRLRASERVLEELEAGKAKRRVEVPSGEQNDT